MGESYDVFLHTTAEKESFPNRAIPANRHSDSPCLHILTQTISQLEAPHRPEILTQHERSVRLAIEYLFVPMGKVKKTCRRKIMQMQRTNRIVCGAGKLAAWRVEGQKYSSHSV